MTGDKYYSTKHDSKVLQGLINPLNARYYGTYHTGFNVHKFYILLTQGIYAF